jgi:hypothetical protein
MVDRKLDLGTYFTNVSPALLSYTVEGCTGEFIGQVPAGLRKPKVRTVAGEKRLLNAKETAQALDAAAKEWAAKAGESLKDGSAKGHTQRTGAGEFVEPTWSLDGTMDATSQKLSDWLALRKVGDDMLILYRQSVKGGWPHVILRASVDLDKYPRLTWRQKEASAPGSFAVKVIDLDSGEMQSLYGETFGGQYDYHAEDLKALFGGGTHNLEVRWYPLGWGMNSPTEKDYFWAEPGQYVVMDFVRFEGE